jgi:IrrE N-terminal-like domain
MLTAWAENLAKSNNILIRFEESMPDGITAYKYDTDSGSVVVLEKNQYPERLNFALAHEVAHIQLNHSGEVGENEEQEANRLASEILLPTDQFAPLAHMSIRELKEFFPHTSFEALARRRIAFVPSVLTLIDDYSLKYRLSSDSFSAPDYPTQFEWDVIKECYSLTHDISKTGDGITANATFIDTGRGIIRVILTVEEA